MAKTLDYDFTDPQFNGTTGIEAQTGPDLTVTRASDASVMDYFNVLKTVGNNEPRFTGGRRVENVILQSEDITTTWTELRATRSANQATAPDGTLTADELIESSDTNTHKLRQSISIAIGTQTVFSGYFKANTRTEVRLDEVSNYPANTWAHFDLSAGTVLSEGAGADASGIEPASNTISGADATWWRCWVVGTKNGGSASDTTIMPGSGGNSSYAGDGSSSIYCWGMQHENVSGQDDPAPSEYIATTTAAKAQWYATKRRTNLCLQSTDFTNASWASVNATELADQATDPDGGSGMDLITATAAGGKVQQSITVPVGSLVSFYARAGTSSTVQLDNGTAAFHDAVTYTLTGDGSVAMTGAPNNEAEGSGTGITHLGDGLYRCWAKRKTGVGNRISLKIANDTETVYLWGAQLETTPQGEITPSAHIATTDAVASSDFDTAITPTGLLIEEARTNLCTYSEDFSNWTYGAYAGTVGSNVTTAPDGTSNADKIIDDSNGPNQTVSMYHTYTLSASTTYIMSVYAKADQLDWLFIRTGGWTDGPGTDNSYFDLANGLTGTVAATHDDSGIESVGNGWYRCWLKFTTATDTAGNIQVGPADADLDNVVTTDGTSSIFVWGADLQAGSFLTSHIPTTTASVTRAADVVSSTDVTWLNQSTGSIYWKGTPIGYGVNFNYLFDIQGNTSNRYSMFIDKTDGSADFDTFTGIGTDGNIDGTQDFVLGVESEMVVGFANNDLIVYLDGVSGGTEAAATIPCSGALTTLSVGCINAANNQMNGHVARVVYYDERLADSVLEDLSNGTFPSAQFPGTIAGDGGHIWPPRSNDPRWAQIISDSGITASGNFIDDVHAALEALGATTGQLDTLWKKVKAANSVTDTSEPYLY